MTSRASIGEVQPTSPAVSFSVRRLSKLKLFVDTPVKLSIAEDIRDGTPLSLTEEERAHLVGDEGFARRIDATTPSDLCGVEGYLQLPSQLGQLSLGETLICYVSACNNTGTTLQSVEIVLEVATVRARTLIYENRDAPIPQLAPDERREFLITYDIKDVGEHHVRCGAGFVNASMEPVLLTPHFTNFVALAPLSIRTKVRTMGESALLEACLESIQMETPLVLDYVRFDPVKRFSATPIALEQDDVQQGPLKEYINAQSIKIMGVRHCARNFLFRLDPVTEGVSQEDLLVKTLGKLEICWQTGFGESGRLQTQQIQGQQREETSVPYEVQGHIIKISPSNVTVYRPFTIVLSLKNLAVDSIGPIAISLESNNSAMREVIAAEGGGIGDDTLQSRAIRMSGPKTVMLDALVGGESKEVTMSLVSFSSGVQMIANLQLRDELTGGVVGTVMSREIFVAPCSGSS